jgi:hypothetical protein
MGIDFLLTKSVYSRIILFGRLIHVGCREKGDLAYALNSTPATARSIELTVLFITLELTQREEKS